MRTATVELWFHPWTALAANLAWTAAALGLLVVALVWPFGGLVLAPLLALPVAGLYRVAALVLRGEAVTAAQGFAAWRTHGRRAGIVGAATIGVLAVLAVDVVVGLALTGGPLGWALATGAAWALLGGWIWLLHLWPLLLDPTADRGVREAGRLALEIAFTFPGRAVRLALASAVVMAVAVVLFAALATFAVAWLAMLGCAVVLPAADRLDRRAVA